MGEPENYRSMIQTVDDAVSQELKAYRNGLTRTPSRFDCLWARRMVKRAVVLLPDSSLVARTDFSGPFITDVKRFQGLSKGYYSEPEPVQIRGSRDSTVL